MVRETESLLPPRAGADLAPAAETIQQQLERILASPEFHATQRQREFLQFVVSERIAGRARDIKAYTVATRVFGRKADFDQAQDPIVSIQANGLRRALERYYLVAGQNDPVRIDIPKGAYVPTFHDQTAVESDSIPSSDEGAEIRFDGLWPAVVVRPFESDRRSGARLCGGRFGDRACHGDHPVSGYPGVDG